MTNCVVFCANGDKTLPLWKKYLYYAHDESNVSRAPGTGTAHPAS